jgi:uncharacterized protein (DUF608 family)
MSDSVIPFSKEQLSEYGSQRVYGRDTTEAAFLLGGIGTGNFSVGSRGDLRDWEIWNRAAKGQKLPYSFFAIAVNDGVEVKAKVLESRIKPPHISSHGYHPGSVSGLPRFNDSRLSSEYPFVNVEFIDDKYPVRVGLEAYTPFIPHERDDSGLPLAILKYTVENPGDKPVEVSISGSMLNAVGFAGGADFGWVNPAYYGQNLNTPQTMDGLKGLYYTSNKLDESSLYHGSHVLATVEDDVTIKPYWHRSRWWDNLREYWDDFSRDGRLTDLGYPEPSEEKPDAGSVAATKTIGPGEKQGFTFLISWYFPNRVKNWDQRQGNCGPDCDCHQEVAKNRYSLRFSNAWDVAKYYVDTREHLETYSEKFREALYGSTLPSYVLDAVASNITVLRSNTCFWLEDGSFFGYEGCFDDAGCCSGSCTHVWNYEQTLAFLFPSLERSMRETEFLIETDKEGKMSFRAFTAFPGTISWDAVEAASDGQCGSIMRLYREWKLSGDTDWMVGLWPGAKRALDYACDVWDQDRDGVTGDKQHNTYDITFYGPNPLSGILFLASLKTGNKLAEAAGDYKAAEKYQELYEKGRVKLDKTLWNGEYYIQKLEDVNEHKYQHGVGCLSDQLLGQINGHLMGLGYLLPPEHVSKAVHSVYKHNFKTDFVDHDNTQRTYVLNDEMGLLACTWPNGGRPDYPFVYSHEVWPGIEYHVAAHLIWEGHIDEGLTIVKAIRDRQDGVKRSPWNEVECGHHYARSMASWGVLLALSGFMYDMIKSEVGFDPRINKDDFSSFWSTGTAWGVYKQRLENGKLVKDVEILHGSL